MSADKIIFPAPMIVKGYACLTGEEVAMAEKNIDPAHPHQGTGGPQDVMTNGEVPFDAQRLSAVRQALASSEPRLMSYTPGAPRTVAVETGTIYSTNA